jgi:hypothetical protein
MKSCVTLLLQDWYSAILLSLKIRLPALLDFITATNKNTVNAGAKLFIANMTMLTHVV